MWESSGAARCKCTALVNQVPVTRAPHDTLQYLEIAMPMPWSLIQVATLLINHKIADQICAADLELLRIVKAAIDLLVPNRTCDHNTT